MWLLNRSSRHPQCQKIREASSFGQENKSAPGETFLEPLVGIFRDNESPQRRTKRGSQGFHDVTTSHWRSRSGIKVKSLQARRWGGLIHEVGGVSPGPWMASFSANEISEEMQISKIVVF